MRQLVSRINATKFYTYPTICIDLITREDLKDYVESAFKRIIITTIGRARNVVAETMVKAQALIKAYEAATIANNPDILLNKFPKWLMYILSKASFELLFVGGKFSVGLKLLLNFSFRIIKRPEELLKKFEGTLLQDITTTPADIFAAATGSRGDIVGIKFPYNFSSIDYNIPVMKSDVDLGAGRFARFSWGPRSYTLSLQGWVNLASISLNNYTDPDFGLPEFREDEALMKMILKTLFSRSTAEPIGVYPGYFFLEFLELFFKEMSRFPMFIFLNDRIWYGWFDSFKPVFSATEPFRSIFTLTFTIHPASGWLIGDSNSMAKGLNIIRNDFGISIGVVHKVPKIKAEPVLD